MPWRPGICTPIGIDAGGRHFCAVQLSRHGAVASATSVRRRDPDIPLHAAELHRLAEVLERQGFRGRRVVLAVPGRLLMSGLLELPPADSGAPVLEIARSEIARQHECEAGGIEVATWPLPRTGRGAARSMGVACARDDANGLLDAFEGAGLEVLALDVAAWALWRAARATAQERVTTAVVSIDWFDSQLVVLGPEVVRFERVLPDLGLHGLHEQFVDELGLDVEATDYLLGDVGLGGGEAAGQGLHEAGRARIEAFIDRLADEVRLSLQYFAHDAPDEAFAGLLLAGEGASISGLHEHLAARVEMPVHVMDLADGPPRISVPAPRLVTAYGLALHALGGSS